MIPFLIPAAVKTFFGNWWKVAAAVLMTAGLCLPLGYCKGQAGEKSRQEAARAQANVETLKVDGASKEVAANEQRVDDALNDERKKELTDAIATLPDELPSQRAVALGCARLRAQGTDTAAIPACGGPKVGAQAPARPGSAR